jgi:hypothetical protein
MGTNTEELAQIGAILANAGAPDITALRKQFPHLSFSKCDASDVIETPFSSYPGCDLHLLNGKDHCVRITSEPAEATGIILAFRRAAS